MLARNFRRKTIINRNATKLEIPSPFVFSYVTHWLKDNNQDKIDNILIDELELYFFKQFSYTDKRLLIEVDHLLEIQQLLKKINKLNINNADLFTLPKKNLPETLLIMVTKSYLNECNTLRDVVYYIWAETKNILTSLKPLFHKFLQSKQYIQYTRWKYIEINLRPNYTDFYIHLTLGYGGFGDVYAVRHLMTGKMFAMKRINKHFLESKRYENIAFNEKTIMQRVECDFIVNLCYSFQTNNYVYIIMDLMEGGDLEKYISRRGEHFNINETLFYSAQIILALEYLHAMKIIHMDIKPKNVLLDCYGHSRVSDMGLARYSGDLVLPNMGTRGYMAPELVRKEKATYAADYFSLGCTIVKMVIGLLLMLFRSTILEPKSKTDKVYQLEPNFYYLQNNLSYDCFDLIYGLLQDSPDKRLGSSLNAINDIKDHKFFSGLCWIKMFYKQIPPPIFPQTLQIYSNFFVPPCQTISTDFNSFSKCQNYESFEYVDKMLYYEEIINTGFLRMKEDEMRKQKRNKKLCKKALKLMLKTPTILCCFEIFEIKKYVLKKWKRRFLIIYDDKIVIMEKNYKFSKEINAMSIKIKQEELKKTKCINICYKRRNYLIRGNNDEETEWLYCNIKNICTKTTDLKKIL